MCFLRFFIILISVLGISLAQLEPQTGFRAEYWRVASGFNVRNLTGSKKFYREPNSEKLVGARSGIAKYTGARLRGYITAPKSGHYQFWVSATTSAELWLSPSESKYEKALIAQLGGDYGGNTGGVFGNSKNLWDQFTSQASELIYLEEGQSYFIEVLSKQHHAPRNRHVSFAWKTPDGLRSVVPRRYLTPYILEEEDQDDDYLPDAYEQLHGLDVTDNGFVNLTQEGERGDYDGDGLLNREEYLLGTNPTSDDSDNDGIKDLQEIQFYGTDPMVSNSIYHSLISEIDLWNESLIQEGWSQDGDSIRNEDVRVGGNWNLDLPRAGVFFLKVSLKLGIRNYTDYQHTLEVTLNDELSLSGDLSYNKFGQGEVIILLPYLEEGSHDLELFVNNFSGSSGLSINRIEVVEQEGEDLDQDGIADHVKDFLKTQSYLTNKVNQSYFSPFVLEGVSRLDVADVKVSVDGDPSEVLLGVGQGGWYSELALDLDSPSSITYQAEEGVIEENFEIEWIGYPLMEGGLLEARQYDSIKLDTAVLSRYEVTEPSGLTSSYASHEVAFEFSQQGRYSITAYDHSGSSAVTEIDVYQKAVSATKYAGTEFSFLKLSTDMLVGQGQLSVDAGSSLSLQSQATSVTGEVVTVGLRSSGRSGLGFRMGDGRLVAVLDVYSLRVLNALAVNRQSVSNSGIKNTDLFTQYMLFEELPEGWTVEVTVLRGGVSFFGNGRSRMRFTAEDLENGYLALELLRNKRSNGGLCMKYTIFDENGNVVR